MNALARLASRIVQLPSPQLRTVCVLLLCGTSSYATDFVVSPGQSIQAKIDSASDGDRVLVQPGTYQQVFDFKGKRIEVRSTGGADVTVLDGSNDAISVVTAGQSEPLGTLLAGFTITNGRGTSRPSSYGLDYYGGAVYAVGGTRLRIEDCRIIHNGWNSGGFNNCTFAGGVYSDEAAQVTIRRTVIADNWAWACGGASLSNGSGTMMTFDRCTVVSNVSTTFFGPQGGIGMSNDGDVTVLDSIVYFNFGNQIDAFGPPYNQGCVATASYSCVQAGFAGTGNISADPSFVQLATLNLHLLSNSPCIDSGDPAAHLDADGTRADMGAISFGQAPSNYCTAKVNSQGCLPSIGFVGSPSLAGPDDFHITATLVRNHTSGLLFWGSAPDSVPFAGGLRCVHSPVLRTPIQNSGGSSSPIHDCSGHYDFHFSHAYMATYFLVAGSTVYAQYWQRDPAQADGTGQGLTDGLRVTIVP